MNLDWQLIGQWIGDNSQALTLSSIITVLAATFTYILKVRIIPMTVDRMLMFIVKVVSKMFGMDQEDVSDVVQELPFVKDINKYIEANRMDAEVKLIDLKNKLISNKLSEAEIVAYEAEFSLIMVKLGDGLSEKTKEALDTLEKIAKEKDVL